MTTTVARREASPQSRRPSRGRIANRVVGVGFAAAAIGNAVSTQRRSTWFVEWMAESGDAGFRNDPSIPCAGGKR
jgi:hypothetical protein